MSDYMSFLYNKAPQPGSCWVVEHRKSGILAIYDHYPSAEELQTLWEKHIWELSEEEQQMSEIAYQHHFWTTFARATTVRHHELIASSESSGTSFLKRKLKKKHILSRDTEEFPDED